MLKFFNWEEILIAMIKQRQKNRDRRLKNHLKKMQDKGIDIGYLFSDELQEKLKKLRDNPPSHYKCEKCGTTLITYKEHTKCCNQEMKKETITF